MQDRLDSWKAIAAYLQRDESTVRRWERELRLPVRRVAGGRGSSVFAYVSEIDEWLKKTRPTETIQTQPTESVATTKPTKVPLEPVALRRPQWGLPITAAALLVVVGILIWRIEGASASEWNVTLTPTAISMIDSGGHERWHYSFPGERVTPLDGRRTQPADVLGGMEPTIVVGTGLQVSLATDRVRGGQLLSLSPEGRVQRTFAFDDRVAIGANTYEGPWGITDFRVDDRPGSRRIAVASHHYEWWPSLVTILDDEWHRRATFLNAGWVEHLRWASPDRLLIAGFSEALDGGMVALLDANALDGQSPGPAEGPPSIGQGRPVRYVVMPRSEINRITASRFNRAQADLNSNGILVHTVEAAPTEADVVDALYEFTPELDFIRASYSDRYWDMHRALEAQGKLHHTRAQCPERDGPREIQVWDIQHGWRAVRPRALGTNP